MSLNAATVWEVRTTGAATNGGGFYNRTPGTSVDYSQQDAAQLAPTNLYRVAANSLYSDSFVFTAAMVGNIIYIASGTHFTAGYYEITARTDNTHVTLDRDPASEDTSAHKDGVGKVGGATNHPQTIAAVLIEGNKIYIKSGTYQPVGANAYVLSTAAEAYPGRIFWIGYDTSRTATPTGTNRPLFDANTQANGLIIGQWGNVFANIRIDNSTDDGVTCTVTGFVMFNCKISNSGDNGINASSTIPFLINCEITLCSDRGVVTSNYAQITNCYIHDNTGQAVDVGSAITSIFHSIADTNIGSGFDSTGDGGCGICAVNSVAYNNSGATSDGFVYAGGDDYLTRPSGIINCSSISNGRYAFNASRGANDNLFFDYNNYYGHATELNNITAGNNDTGDDDPEFTAAADGDFTLGATSPLLDKGASVSSPSTGVTGTY